MPQNHNHLIRDFYPPPTSDTIVIKAPLQRHPLQRILSVYLGNLSMILLSTAISFFAILYTAALATAIQYVCSDTCVVPIPSCTQGYIPIAFQPRTPDECWRCCQTIPDGFGCYDV